MPWRTFSSKAPRLERLLQDPVDQLPLDVEREARDHRVVGQRELEATLQHFFGRVREASGQRHVGQRPDDVDIE
jgi:hypothetical protein